MFITTTTVCMSKLNVLLVYPACSKLKYYASEADSRKSTRSLFPLAHLFTLAAERSCGYKRRARANAQQFFAEEPRLCAPAVQRWYSNYGDGTLRLRSLLQGDGGYASTIGQDYSLHYPVGESLFGDSLPLLLSSKADKELVWGPGVCLLPGQRLQVHHLTPEGRGGNFGHISRPGSQDNVRVTGPDSRHESSTENACRSPTLVEDLY